MWVLDGESGFEGLVVRRGVIRCEGDVVFGMEVFRRDFEGERICKKLVDGWYDVASTLYCKRSVLS